MNQLPLRTLLLVMALACAGLAIARPSVGSSLLVVVAVALAISGLLIRQLRGEFVVLLLVAVPLVLLAIAWALGVLPAG